ncbi:MAG TPA: rhomboid family intramembrane serine protease [Kiloniellales bacterium]|nr:rhomboid family intramembrane serine protease [Kiloniellales bacterium]
MVQLQEDPWVVIRRCRLRREAERYALVLAAMGIASRIRFDGERAALLVAAADAEPAEREIAAYVRENSHQPPPPLTVQPAQQALLGVGAYACLLLFLNGAAIREAFGFDWLMAGAAQAGLIGEGQVWRAATALGLHGDGSHLLGNLAFGGLFGFLLAQLIGAGLAWLAILLAGIFGNLLAAQLHPAPHTSIGASTAVFGALGLLVVLSWLQQAPRRLRGLRRWMPFAAGAMLFAYLGIGDERTDVLAHVTGFVGGVAVGLLLAWVKPSLQPERQLGYGIGALFVFSLAWILALAA